MQDSPLTFLMRQLGGASTRMTVRIGVMSSMATHEATMRHGVSFLYRTKNLNLNSFWMKAPER